MSYYIKKTNLKKGLYLQIYEGHHDSARGRTVTTLYRKLGYLEDLKDSGIADPVAHFQEEVNELNRKQRIERRQQKSSRILVGKESIEKNIGYHLVKEVLDGLGAKKYMDLYQSVAGYRFNVYDTMSALVFSRIIRPCSKSATFHDVLPLLFRDYDVSYPQILDCCEFLGSEYEKFVELFTAMTERKYGIDSGSTYFDCTNFYFEIDREDDFRRKGPSKENRKEPIAGLALLLDRNMIPIGMRMYRGSDSEKPVLRSLIEDMKKRSSIKGRTVQVADKGLNCANNIIKALLDGDGYIFSRSVKTLSEKERIWMEVDEGWTDVLSPEGELRYRYKECMDEFDYVPSDEDVRTVLGAKSARVREKRVLTFNPDLAKKQIAELEKMAEKAYGMCLSRAKRTEFGDSAKYIVFRGSGSEAVSARVDWDKVEEDKKLCGYNLLVTSELNMSAQEIYSAYHGLWRIEESFRVMKSELEARPVFMQKMDCIIGHFLICYIACLVIRLLQIKEMDDSCSVQGLLKLIRELRVVQVAPNSYLNLARSSDLLDKVCRRFSVPLNNLFFDNKTISLLKLD